MRRVFFLLLLPIFQTLAQPLQIDPEVFATRREVFMKQLAPQSVAILPCKPEYIRNGDVEF